VCWPHGTQADTIAVSFTGGTVATDSGGFTIGWSFDLSAPVLITGVGVWDQNGDGLAGGYAVQFRQLGGQVFNFLGSAFVPAGTSAPLIDGFRYVPLSTPLLLGPGSGYSIFSEVGTSTPPDAFIVSADSVSTAAGITYRGGSAGAGAPNSYFGPNFMFVSLSNTVPDSAPAWLLLSLGFVLLFAFKFLSAAAVCTRRGLLFRSRPVAPDRSCTDVAPTALSAPAKPLPGSAASALWSMSIG